VLGADVAGAPLRARALGGGGCRGPWSALYDESEPAEDAGYEVVLAAALAHAVILGAACSRSLGCCVRRASSALGGGEFGVGRHGGLLGCWCRLLERVEMVRAAFYVAGFAEEVG
jgi:hypothetical protein